MLMWTTNKTPIHNKNSMRLKIEMYNFIFNELGSMSKARSINYSLQSRKIICRHKYHIHVAINYTIKKERVKFAYKSHILFFEI